MTKQMTREEVTEFLFSKEWVPGVTLDESSLDKTFSEVGLDSLDLLNVIVEFEDELEIDIDINGEENISTLNNVIDLILRIQADAKIQQVG
ncbi:phosphopantetheine-binding protein [Terasakiella pusilla]|uniref:phosphopantetheine-binding protein n=1 Tax=Terasakiella pusilla TaxID=64973 RepID=UPI003AA88E53